MASQGVEETRRLFGDAPFAHSQVYTPYDKLMRQSRKLGSTATQALDGAAQGAKQILGQKTKQSLTNADSIEELKKAVAHAHEVLVKVRTVLPFVFPDEISLDRTKITIIKRNFFWSSEVISIRVEDILNVSASLGPLFGGVTVASRVMSSIDHFEVGRFWRDDAGRMKQILQGYLIARQDGIQTDHLSCKELVETFCELGKIEE